VDDEARTPAEIAHQALSTAEIIGQDHGATQNASPTTRFPTGVPISGPAFTAPHRNRESQASGQPPLIERLKVYGLSTDECPIFVRE
jgi:hypothetical protein